MRRVGVVGGFVKHGFHVVLSGLFEMFGCFLVMFGCLLRHVSTPFQGISIVSATTWDCQPPGWPHSYRTVNWGFQPVYISALTPFRLSTFSEPVKPRGQSRAARLPASVASNSGAVRVLRLDRGDALLIDNRCVLRGRREFVDPARQRYRIRFWRVNAEPLSDRRTTGQPGVSLSEKATPPAV